MTRAATYVIVTLAALMCSGTIAHAATITWGAATTISNSPTPATAELDISTTGTLVGAINLGGPGVANSTVNGVLFSAVTIPNNAAPVALGSVATLTVPVGSNHNGVNVFLGPTSSTPYDNILLHSAFPNGSTLSQLNLTLNNLTIGKIYLFQTWANDSRNGIIRTVTIAAGNSVVLDYNNTNALNGYGQFVIGTFVADATTQFITFISPAPTVGSAQINAFQVRDLGFPVVVPTPAALPVGLAALAMIAVRRRN